MQDHDRLWSKTGTDGHEWMTLTRHLTDTASVEPYAWNRFVSRGLEDSLTSMVMSSGGSNDPDRILASLRLLSQFMAGIHDVGKASPVFQAQANGQYQWLADASLSSMGTKAPDPSYRNSSCRHEIITATSLLQWFGRVLGHRLDRRFVRSVRPLLSLVIGHHGYYDEDKEAEKVVIRNMDDDVRNVWLDGARKPTSRSWTQARLDLIDGMADRIGVTADDVRTWAALDLPAPVQVILSGVIVVSDWMASDQDAFPCADDGVLTTDEDARLQHGLAMLDIPDGWRPESHCPNGTFGNEEFNLMFPGLGGYARMNAVQESMVRMAQKGPGLLVCEAPMGCGKTEASLAAAWILACGHHADGIEYALPTMATTDSMYGRVMSWASSPIVDAGSVPVSLQHGDAWLNDDWRKDRTRRGPWLSRRRTASLASIDVSTIDHLLGMGLRHGHIDLDHLGYAGKVVIIDEMHSADEYMMNYVERTLAWLGAYHTPVIILSATLSASMRKRLVESYAHHPVRELESGYPMLTAVMSDGSVIQEQVDGDVGSRGSITIAPSTRDAVVNEVLDAVADDGGCAAVIMDTVRGAQDMAKSIRDGFNSRGWNDDQGRVMLLHSRYCKQDRHVLESELIGMLGPGGRRPHRLVVVATQVIEQSLDLDFDGMWTEMAPVDVLLQRSGRLQRRGGKLARPSSMRNPVLHVIGLPDTGRGVPRWLAKDHGSPLTFVYDRSLLMRTVVLLDHTRSVDMPGGIPELVHSVYDQDGTMACPNGWSRVMTEADEACESAILKSDMNASSRLVGPPEVHDLIGLTSRKTDTGMPSVREGLQSLSVVLVMDNKDGTVTPAADPTMRVPVDKEPDWEQSVVLRKSEVGLPSRFAGSRTDDTLSELEKAEENLMPTWRSRESSVSGSEIAVLDDVGACHIGGGSFHYDKEYGVT